MDYTTCVKRNSQSVKDIFLDKIDNKEKVWCDNNNNYYYPKEYFSPKDYETGVMNITENTISIHWFDASWISNYDKFKLFTKDKIKRIIGKKRCERIKAMIKVKRRIEMKLLSLFIEKN